MKNSTIPLFLLLALLSARGLSQPSDEYLIGIRLDSSTDPRMLETLQLPLYHRFEQTLVAGLRGEKLEQIQRSGIRFTILDSHPWSDTYYLLTSRKVDMTRADLHGGTILVRDEGSALVKARSIDDLSLDGGLYEWTEMRRTPFLFRDENVIPHVGMPLGSDSVIAALVGHISADTVRRFIQDLQNFGTRYCLAPNRDTLALWIQQQFLGMGYTDVRLDSFYYSNTWQQNVIATLPGTTKPDQIILIGGHHDSYSSGNPMVVAPGADDNASGTAAVLEIARILQLTGYRPKCTIMFATFAAEERGLIGSRAHAQRMMQSGVQISLMINHDMISYTSTSPSLSTVDINYYSGYEYLRDAAADMVWRFSALTPHNGRANSSGSDSYSYWSTGFPAVYFAETQFSPFYHSPQDIISNYSMEYCAEVIKASCGLAMTYSAIPARVQELAIADVGDGTSLLVTWRQSTELDVAGYRVFVGSASARYDTSYLVADTSCVVGHLSEGTTTFIGVAAVDMDGSEGFVTERTGTPHLYPRTPANVAAEPQWRHIRLQWQPNSELDLLGYDVYRSTSLGETPVMLNAVPLQDTMFVDNTAQDGLYYFYTVAAVDSMLHESAPTAPYRSRVVSLNKGILLANETKEGDGSPGRPTRAEVNDFYHKLLVPFNVEEFDVEDAGSATLADLGAYSTVVWHGDDYSSFDAARASQQHIRKYLDFGGKLLITCYRPTSAFGSNISTRDFVPGEFVYEYLKIRHAVNSFGARFNGALPLANGYPPISVDTTKTLASLNHHLTAIEGIAATPGATDIYRYDSAYDTTQLAGKMIGQPVGVEYLGPSYKVISLSFPLYYMDFDAGRQITHHILTELFSEVTAASDLSELLPTQFELLQNYPNPFNPTTKIQFSIVDRQLTIVKVYDVLGREVSTLVNGMKEPGTHTVEFDASNLPSGVYFYRLQTADFIETKKLMVLK
jgi:hypothetical protein